MPRPLLILTSRSPRRALLLREAGYVFAQLTPSFDDPAHPGDHQPEQPLAAGPGGAQALAMDIARRKVLSVPLPAGRQAVLLAADTLIVHADGTLAGTPQSEAQALAMIRAFLGVTHRVVSGVALRGPGDEEPDCFADTAEVAMGPISAEDLGKYVAGGMWRGKAGGYNLFERRDAGWPIRVVGEETTVVGLPMPQLQQRLARHGIEPTAGVADGGPAAGRPVE